MPTARGEEWVPFELDCKRLAVISDVHIPYHSEVAFSASVDWLKKQSPDCLLINGDFADFYAVSRHQKDPRQRDFKAEMNGVRQGLEWLRHEFGKNCRIVWKLGNHEERWQVYLWNHAPEICDLEQVQLDQICKVESFGVEIVDEQRPCMAGKLPIFHGHELGKGISSPVNPARGAFMRTNHTVMVGHHHRTSAHSDPDLWHEEIFTWSVGCLAQLNPEYARVNKWNHGFAYVEIGKDGSFGVSNLRLTRDGTVRAS
jgi:predicted phosphodiesterase